MNLASWDKSGQGNNIRHLFTPKEREIWDKALPYQDKRNDVGHAEHVVYFALKLLELIAGAERAIVIPAAVLHDTGWSKLMPKVFSHYDPFSEDFKKNKLLYRNIHQKASLQISKKILKQVNYPNEFVPAILEIVSQHDTREGFFCAEDGIVRDADKLWRFTLQQMQADYFKRMTVEKIKEIRMNDIENSSYFYSGISRQIARAELEQTIKYLTGNRR